jgi:multiple sugar transport system substrate-binding protein
VKRFTSAPKSTTITDGAAMTPIPPTRPAPGDLSRRAFLSSIALGGLGLGLAGCKVIDGGVLPQEQQGLQLSREAAPGRERTIEMYSVWGGLAGNAWCSLAELYEKSQTHTGVKVTYAPQSADTQVRLLTAIAAGTPPDVAFVTPETHPQLVGLGVMKNLDDDLRRDDLGESDFVPAVWKQMTATGSVYTMPGMVDPNFPLFWNKTLFAEAGLDPEAAPETIDDLERAHDAIFTKNGRRITRIGTIPWSYYGYANSMYTLGFAFGGKFVSDDNETVTPDDPNVVAGLEWMVDFAKKVGGAGNVAVSSPAQTLPVIASGNVGMMPMTGLDAINVYANAKDVELGSALFPYAEGMGQPGGASWLGGWSAFIPSEAKSPDAAWDFIRFCSATDEGTLANYEKQTAIAGYADSPALQQLGADPKTAIYRDVLLECKNVRPTIPVASTYAQQLDIYVGQAVFGQITPKQALAKVAAITNAEWDQFRKDHP